MEENIKSDLFDWQGIHILQDEAVHKVGTDAVLLGAWVSSVVPHASAILDAGTGSGILALMMARQFPQAKIHAVDIDMQAIQLATENVKHINPGRKIVVAYEDVLEKPLHIDEPYDLIICNPPFYSTHKRPLSESKARAKHMNGDVKKWINGLLSRISAKGHLCIIVPGETASQWISAANYKGYHNLNRLDIFSYADDASPKRSLLHFTSGLDEPHIGQLCIYTKANSYTPDYLALTGIRSGK